MLALGALGLAANLLPAALHEVVLDQPAREEPLFGTTIFGFGTAPDTAGVWPCNQWSNFDVRRYEEDLRVLQAEGGNAATILVPYFTVDGSEPLARHRLDQLRQVFALCDGLGIKLKLRLGYAWDNGFRPSTHAQQVAILTDPAARQRWYEFCAAVYELASHHQSYQGALICWEDFWTFYLHGASLDEAGRRQWAAEIRYPQPIVPSRSNPDMADFYDQFDEMFANEFFPATQQRVPGLGMEVRLDDDPVFENGRQISAFVHRKLFAAPGLRDIYLYWGPYLGALNQGDEISADTALRLLRTALEKAETLSAPGSRLILSQFNYRDNTPGFSQNSKIRPDELEDFIRRAGTMLRQYCAATFTWTNGSYYHNAVLNGTFALGRTFWDLHHALADITDQQVAMTIFPGGSITQAISYDAAATSGLVNTGHATFEFAAKSASATTCTVTIGNQAHEVAIAPSTEWKRYAVQLEKPAVAGQVLRIAASEGMLIDDIILANHRQDMGAQDPRFARDVSYANLAQAIWAVPATPAATTILSGVAADGWVSGTINVAVPAANGRYHTRLRLMVPEFLADQAVVVSLRPSGRILQRVPLAAGAHEIDVSGVTGDAQVHLAVGFEKRARPAPPSTDVRELAARFEGFAP